MIQARRSEAYLDKDSILSLVSEYDIFKFYCPPFKDLNKKFKSELRVDNSPTCSITYYNRKLLYKDFGRGDSYDCFSYVQAKYNLNFIEALKVIDNDFGLGLNMGATPESIGVKISKNLVDYRVEKTPMIISRKSRKWNNYDTIFWGKFNISIEILNKFDVIPLDYFWLGNVRYSCHTLTYGYKINGRYKIYRPFEIEGKWFSNTNKTDIQGYKQLKGNGDIVFLASSLKDVMTLYSMGYAAIALQSEMQFPSDELISEMKDRFKLVAVLYDNDFHSELNPGQTMATKICHKFDLFNVIIPAHYRSKDISDLVRDHGVDCAKRIITIQIPA